MTQISWTLRQKSAGCGKSTGDLLFIHKLIFVKHLQCSRLSSETKNTVNKTKPLLSLLLGETDFKRMFINRVAGGYNK